MSSLLKASSQPSERQSCEFPETAVSEAPVTPCPGREQGCFRAVVGWAHTRESSPKPGPQAKVSQPRTLAAGLLHNPVRWRRHQEHWPSPRKPRFSTVQERSCCSCTTALQSATEKIPPSPRPRPAQGWVCFAICRSTVDLESRTVILGE